MMSEKVGSVLVVGAGISGMQSALDLANSGFKVYLMDKSPAIGGVMAQLDKTFPTNDCAMCIVSPRLVEAGGHLNIELMPLTELISVEGEPGNFTATVVRHPRYIDLHKCTSCGDCERVCPIKVTDPFNEGLSDHAATSRPYAQAVPNAYSIEKRGTSPCKHRCPADTSAQGYIALIAAKRYEEAFEVIKQYNPFPATVGRVCPHPCEEACNRGDVDQPLAICALKRFVADKVYAKWGAEGRGEEGNRELSPFVLAPPEMPPEHRRKVAIVGAGPAGLSAAYFLARMGYKATIFEALPVPGGMMRVGIPPYRLPREVLAQEIDEILKLGVELRLNSAVRNVKSLFDQGYSSIFLAIGAHAPQKLNIEGEDVYGVFHGVPLLRSISLGEKVNLGDRVVVVGGGNTAIDSARTALRLGSRKVTMVYRRTRVQMPANDWEVEEALAEGVDLQELTQPIEVLSEEGHVAGIRCLRMELGEPDASGRRRPIPIKGSEFVIECDAMVAAVAQAPELSFLEPDHGLKITKRGSFDVDPDTLATNISGIFAGGDATAGPGVLIQAIADGRRAALSIDRYLRGVPLRTPREITPLPIADLSDDEVADILKHPVVDGAPRQPMPTASIEDRINDFREVELGLTEEQAHVEAMRCLRCGICSECYQCVLACQPGAIDHQQTPTEESLKVGSIIVAPGFDLYDPEPDHRLGSGRYPNVVTSLQFERLLSPSGPTSGHVVRPSDQKEPRRIAWIQCVGSRDKQHDYCSTVCCMYAIKEAMIVKEHSPEPLDATIYFMDIRAFGKEFEEYYTRAREEQGIEFVRSRPAMITEDPETGNVIVHSVLDGSPDEKEFDMVVLSAGLEPPKDAEELAHRAGFELKENGFCETGPFTPLETSREGIFVCGSFSSPKDIPDSVAQASGAAAMASSMISEARGQLVVEEEFPEEKDTSNVVPRIGVFVCHCGINIASVVDVPGVTEYARSLPGVVFAVDNLYTCSQDTQESIKEAIKEHDLNRVIVASCSPRTHEPLFKHTTRQGGLNPFLFEMANIRDQCSWVHMEDKPAATEKAKDLVRMAVAKSAKLEPLQANRTGVEHSALVVGGGVSGMAAALGIADQGYEVHLVEREAELGGQMRNIHHVSGVDDPQAILKVMIEKVLSNTKIQVHTGSEIAGIEGFVGNFEATVVSGGEKEGPEDEIKVRHGVVVVATGGMEYRPTEYLYGQNRDVMTQLELDAKMSSGEGLPKSTVMIQCVGSRNEERPYCSRVCCSHAVNNAVKLKENDPDAEVFILYKDIRTYGFHEGAYRSASESGVRFIRYDDEHLPEVSDVDGRLRVRVRDPVLGDVIELRPDKLVLSAAIIPQPDNEVLAQMLKVPLTKDKFFLEAHMKLRPVEFATEGVFLCGLAHSPKFIDENISQAYGAVSKACTILSKDTLIAEAKISDVDEALCVGCGLCVEACPFNAIELLDGKANVNAALCKGCGLCAATCRSGAIQQKGYRDEQILRMIKSCAEEVHQ